MTNDSIHDRDSFHNWYSLCDSLDRLYYNRPLTRIQTRQGFTKSPMETKGLHKRETLEAYRLRRKANAVLYEFNLKKDP